MKNIPSIIFTFLAVLVIYFTFTGKKGLLHLTEINNELETLQDKDKNLEIQISSLKNEIESMKTNESTLEKKARNELSLSKKNEIIYIFSKN